MKKKPRKTKSAAELSTDLDKWLAAGEKVIATSQEILELFKASPVMAAARERQLEERVVQLEAELQLVAAVLTALVAESGPVTVTGKWVLVKPLPLVLDMDGKSHLITAKMKGA